MVSRTGSKGDNVEMELIKLCPWRNGERCVTNADELWAYLAYHQAAEMGGECSGYFSIPGEEGVTREWKASLRPGAFGCVMGSKEVRYRPPDEIQTLSLTGVKYKGAMNLTPAQEYARCIKYLQEGGAPTPPDWFNCLILTPGSWGHELLSELREKL